MKCFHHPDVDAVGTCPDCNRALCRECAGRYSVPICDQCNEARLKRDKVLVYRNISIMAALFLIPFFLTPLHAGNIPGLIVLGFVFAGLPWGWSALNRITPNIFLIMPIIGWVIYFIVKLWLSLLIGVFVMPFKIYSIVKEFQKFRSVTELKKVSA